MRNRTLFSLAALIATLCLASTADAGQLFAPAYYGPGANPDQVGVFNTAPDGTATEVPGSPFGVGTASTGNGIGSMALAPDGTRGAIAYSFNGGIQGVKIGTDGAVTPAQPVVGAHQGPRVAVTPDGRFAYQAIGSATHGVDAYSIAADGALTVVAGSPFFSSTAMHDVVVAPDGAHAYASDGLSVRPFTINSDGSLTAMPAHAASGASSMGFTSDGRFLIVQVGSQTIGAMPVAADGSLGDVVNTVTVGSTAVYVFAVSPDGQFVYAVDYNGDTLGQNSTGDWQYSVNAYRVGADGTLTLSGAGSTLPFRGRAIGISPDGRYVYLGSDSGRVAVAALDAGGKAGAFRDTGAWSSGEPVPFVFRPVFAGAAAFSVKASTTPLKMSFDGEASTSPDGTVDNYDWSFGDGSGASGAATTHKFAKAGVYEVTLTAVNDGCSTRSLYDGHTTICNGSPAAAKTISVDTPPWITSLKISKRTLSSRTTVRFKLTESATVSFYVQKPMPGRVVGKSCKKPTKSNAKGKKCTRWVRASKTFKKSGKGGKTNSFKFNGTVKRKTLKRGKYRLYAVATDKAKGKSPSKTVGFRVR